MDIEIPSVETCLATAPSWNDLLTKMNHNERLLKDILVMMSREAPKLCLAFGKAVEAGNSREACRAVHTLKSNCRQFDLTSFSEFAQKLEELAKSERIDELARFVPSVDAIGNGISEWAEEMLDKQA